jgi:hypothetical protein
MSLIPDPRDPRKKKDIEKEQSSYDNVPGSTTEKYSGEEALLQSSPTDADADEKVIVNSSQENKIVNSPSQTSAGINKDATNDEANL